MKTKTVFTLALALIFFSGASNAEEITNLVQEEFNKMKQDYHDSFTKVARRVNDLTAYRNRVVNDSRRKAEYELQGVDLLRKYNTLIQSRYRNDQGNFERGLEISPKDGENIGKVFAKYLGCGLSEGRLSAGEARRQLESGIVRLQESAKRHLEPSEENNSELELVAYQLRDSEVKMKKTSDLAKALGIEINEQAALAEAQKPEVAASNREVASPTTTPKSRN
jgi:hypothetical protein